MSTARTLICLSLVAALIGCTSAPNPPSTTPAPPTEESQRFSLEIRLVGLEAGRGQVVVAIYGDASSFDENGRPYESTVLPVEGTEITWALELPAGAYAVKVYQDLDEDGELDRGDFGVPSEPYGFSNDARSTFGPPSWSAARFEVASKGQHSISLR